MCIKDICKSFGITGEIVSREIIKSGHINNTQKITVFEDGKEDCYIVQQINTYVFKEPYGMMRNIRNVTSHIANKLGADSDRKVLKFLTTESGEGCLFDDEDKCWRAYKFIDNSVTYDTCEDLEILEQAGVAFGRFQMMLSDFDASALVETIPDFHDTEKRLDTFFEYVKEDPLGRAKEAEAEIAFFKEISERAAKLTRMQKSGEIPLRVTHNDTKCNNVLFDTETKKALAVIDLDTVMPGLALYDYGDAIRFSACTAEEDEHDLSKVAVDNGKFLAFTKGYLSESGAVLTKAERENLLEGVIGITTELASRFLGDYIMGDKYFKIDYPDQNLARARAQIQIVKDVIARYGELSEMIKKLLK